MLLGIKVDDARCPVGDRKASQHCGCEARRDIIVVDIAAALMVMVGLHIILTDLDFVIGLVLRGSCVEN